MTRIYRYILTHDHGMAPCPAGGLITLATCKPVIRRNAALGDWVLGFPPGSLHRGLLLWAGRVERVMTHGDYQRAHRGRRDAVYREIDTGRHERLASAYHPTQKEMDRDLSAPVLLFDAAVSLYLDGQPRALPEALAHLAAAGRGHRVNGTQADDVAALVAWLATLNGSRPGPVGRIGAGCCSGAGRNGPRVPPKPAKGAEDRPFAPGSPSARVRLEPGFT